MCAFDPSWSAANSNFSGSRRRSWATIPLHVRSWVERCVGAPVVDAIDQSGGFSEGLAARVVGANETTVFVKAVHATSASAVAQFHRAEITTSAMLPVTAPVPRLLDSYDDGEWIALVFNDVVGKLPEQPWRADELNRVSYALTELTEALTPTPLPQTFRSPRLGGWQELATSPAALARLDDLAPSHAVDLTTHLELEAELDQFVIGDTLVHGDLYPFNVLLTDAQVVFVDWAHAWVGPPYADLVMLLGSVAASGADPEPFATQHPLLVDVDSRAVDTLISAQAGFLLHRGRRRRFQTGERDDQPWTRFDALARIPAQSVEWWKPDECLVTAILDSPITTIHRHSASSLTDQLTTRNRFPVRTLSGGSSEVRRIPRWRTRHR